MNESMESIMSWTKKAASLGTVWTLILAGSVLLNGHVAFGAQAAKQPAMPAAPVEAPFSENELIKLIKHNKRHLEDVAKEVQTRGTDFEFTPDIVKQLTKAGATEQLITFMKQFSPSVRAGRKSKVGSAEVSAQEGSDYNALKNQKAPDGIIKAADDFTAKYPESPLLTYVYALEASAYQQKNDAVNVLKYGEKSLDLDPKNLVSLLMVSAVLPQPLMVSNISDAEKEKRLGTAEEYAKRALEEIDQLPKQPNESDAAYQKRKNEIASGAYASMGMVHLERSQMSLVGLDQGELAKAEESYKSAIAKSDPPSPADYYRLGEVYRGEEKLDEAITAFAKAGQLAPGTVFEQLANKQIEELKKAKSSKPKAAATP
jgi:tetratricopeptide (TPR) repeat protein